MIGIATVSSVMGFLIPVSSALNTPVQDATLGAPVGLISLRRESVPVQRKGQVVAVKTSYSGTIHVGSPEPQEFRVVFDTGSGHVVLPSVKCSSAVCLKHRRFDATASVSAVAINVDGSLVSQGTEGDRVTIGYGTGKVTGELVREHVCLGPVAGMLPPGESNSSGQAVTQAASTCATVHTVAATELSPNPFSLFSFDGVIGLGLRDLSLSREFNFLDILSRSGGMASSTFGIFLTEGEDGEESELAVGGHNPERLLSPLIWSPVINPEIGYWQVQIKAVHIGDFTLPLCQDGSCRGIIDTGTSHLGVPAPHLKTLEDMLTVAATDMQDDCRLAEAPDIKIELPGFNLTLTPDNYMRRLPLRKDVSVGFWRGVTDQLLPLVGMGGWASSQTSGSEVKQHCRPRLMPVRLPAPLGPDVFILGEPVLHNYYTVFDWATPRIGFGLANSRRQAAALRVGGEVRAEPSE